MDAPAAAPNCKLMKNKFLSFWGKGNRGEIFRMRNNYKQQQFTDNSPFCGVWLVWEHPNIDNLTFISKLAHKEIEKLFLTNPQNIFLYRKKKHFGKLYSDKEQLKIRKQSTGVKKYYQSYFLNNYIRPIKHYTNI